MKIENIKSISFALERINLKEKNLSNSIIRFNNLNNALTGDKSVNNGSKPPKISENEILNGKISVVDKKNFIEGSRLIKTEILANERRKSIFNYITNNPASHIHKISRDLNLSLKITIWHVNILEKYGFIRRNKIDKKIIFFNTNFNKNDELYTYTLINENNKMIYESLNKDEVYLIKAIAENLKIEQNHLIYHLKSLERAGLITFTNPNAVKKSFKFQI